MVLSGEAIKRAINEGIIGIDPYTEEQVEVAHVNLHLGEAEGVTEEGLAVLGHQKDLSLPVREKLLDCPWGFVA
jgi:deoxycytidine triphosphate deaminase